MKTYYAIKGDGKYFVGWNKWSTKLRDLPDRMFVYEDKKVAEARLGLSLYDAERDNDTKELRFWKNAKVIKLSLIEA